MNPGVIDIVPSQADHELTHNQPGGEGKLHFWLLFVGFHTTFLLQHWLGAIGMPRRYADYMPEEGFWWMNQLSTVGSFILAASMLPFFWNVYSTWRNAPPVTVDDPWGYGRSLEWATSCPPPRHNFVSLPRIRSESPAFDLHHPEVAAMEHPELYPQYQRTTIVEGADDK